MNPSLQKELGIILADIAGRNTAPTLLLHTCCAPCGSYALEYLSRYFAVTISYYNPNIHPKNEYLRRLEALEALLTKMEFQNPVRLIAGEYEPEAFSAAIIGLEGEPEGGRRCEACFRLRLEHTARLAAQLNADYFATTLSVGPRKDAQLLHRIAAEAGAGCGVKALPCDLKKRGGYARSVELSKSLGIYRQNYCGCSYSNI